MAAPGRHYYVWAAKALIPRLVILSDQARAKAGLAAK